MLLPFFFKLRAGGIPVAITEFLMLLEGLAAGLANSNVENFYYLSRLCLIKDERYFDRFDRVFVEYFKGAESKFAELAQMIPEEWLRHEAGRELSPEERAQVEALGGWQKLLETLQERLDEQQGRHSGGHKWIGTGGTSPFGAYGFNPEGIRIGQEVGRHRRAVKVWERREYRNFDDTVALGTRNIKMALRKLRKFAREGVADRFDLDGTIESTARNAGLLDFKFVPERRNSVKVLLFMDVGGSMEDHVRLCESIFSAARSEFKRLEYFYFHNFIYESVWKDNARRHTQRAAMIELMRTFGPDYRVVLIGDAAMSPYEIVQPGGSLEHWNEEAGAIWMQRLTRTWQHHAWLNPEPEQSWEYTPSIRITRELLDNKMFPMTLEGLDRAMRALR